MSIIVRTEGPITIVSLARPERRNAVDRNTAELLASAFRAFDADFEAKVGILTGEAGVFCGGADLKAIAAGDPNNFSEDGDGPMGPTRLLLSKPVIAAIAGPAVAGGLELALWCDMRVAEESAVLGVYCRRWGVPLIDGGTIRLPRLIGLSRALDLIMTGRGVPAQEALQMGLVNRVVPDGQALTEAIALAELLANFPQTCLREDRLSAYEQCDLPFDEALKNEFRHGMRSLQDGAVDGAMRFAGGEGRHGQFKT